MESNYWLLSPPLALPIVLLAVGGLALVLKTLAYKPRNQTAGTLRPYACGEEVTGRMPQPDYGQFFPFAFFFTILHVVALMATTVPAENVSTFVFAMIYIAGAVVGLTVLYRK
jgi:NADH:ubiquinone oxidoreductase subunit 3 (subunit A)